MKNKMKINNNNPIPVELEKASNSTGITLVALTITIIVMLILAGIIMYLFSNEGPIEHAKMSKFATEFREIQERVELYKADKDMEKTIENEKISQGNVETLPVLSRVTGEEKEVIKKEKTELNVKINQLSEKEIEQVDLYWIDQEKIETNKENRYMIDIQTGQIYQYEGKKIFGLIWHTLDSGLKEGTTQGNSDDEIWDGWIRLTLYYPTGAKDKEWRIGEEGETRYDKNLMWQEYTGPIWVKLKDIENVWIRYNLNGEDVVIAPSGRLAVDIRPDSYYPDLTDKVKISIYYDKHAELKEYKVGNGPWLDYLGEFYVTENTIVEARAKKTENISDDDGNIIGQKDIWGRDNVYVGNIGVVVEDLEAPTLQRKSSDGVTPNEVAKVEASYPDGAVKKIYKINYGQEQDYTGDISITKYGTHVIAFYYNSEGKRSKATQIIINEGTPQAPGGYIPNQPGIPGTGGNPGSGGNSGAPTNPSYLVPSPNINVSPTGVTNSVSVTIDAPNGYVANKIYYKIGNGSYQLYTGSISLNYNTTIKAYYITSKGEISASGYKRINNIQVPGMPYVKIEADPDPYTVKYGASKVTVKITAQDANTIEYSLNGIVYQNYTNEIEITQNQRIYAKGTNSNGSTITYFDITNIGNIQNIQKPDRLNVSIQVNPEPKLTNDLVGEATVIIEYDERAQNRYYQIGQNGTLIEYKGEFKVTSNCMIYAYALSSNGQGSTSKQIDHLTTGISAPQIIADPSSKTQASDVTITINFDRNATITRYKIDNGSYIDYTGPIVLNENATITAYNKNKLGYDATSTYTANNIIPSTTVVIDKGKYYLLKLAYPPTSVGREYKWQENGTWKSYPEQGILLIKPEYKNNILNAQGQVKIKIEDENGQLIDFKGDYYFTTGTVQELLENVYMRWSRNTPKEPSIIVNTTEPAKEVTVVITYSSTHVKKEYKIVEPDGTTSGWKDYTQGLTITKKNTIIYARGQDEAEVWSKESMKKISNIDEDPPAIKVTADLQKQAQKVGIKVEVTDDVKVEAVMWAKGIRGESYFNSQGNIIQNDTIFYVAENGYYTIYAKDGVGNTSTYTLQVTNVDLTAPNIQIAVTPENTIGIEVKINIDYGDSTTKEYKIGENNSTWTTYTGEITLTSNTVIANSWKNQDNTVTIYAKGKDSVGNETIETQKILSLDLDEPKTPVITSNYGYPILTEYGVQFDGETTITYDTRKDIDNYYSTNNGTTWQKYTGTFQLPGSGTIIAKSIKKGSGLEVIASKEVTIPSDAIGPAAYDEDSSTYFEVYGYCYNPSKKYVINISDEMQGKNIVINLQNTGGEYIAHTQSRIGFIDESGTKLSEQVYSQSVSKRDIVLTIPNGAKKLEMQVTASNVGSQWQAYAKLHIYQVGVTNQPEIVATKHYPNLSKYKVEPGYNIVKINYFPTSTQRLYKIGDGSWKIYTNQDIRLDEGQVIYAKGIDKNGQETHAVSSYTSVLPSDAIGKAAYDEDSSSYFEVYGYCHNPSNKYVMNISDEMQGKNIVINLQNTGGEYIAHTQSRIGFIDGNGTKLSEQVYSQNVSKSDIVLTIPNGAKKLEMQVTASNVGSQSQTYAKLHIYGVGVANEPEIVATKHYPNLSRYKVEPGYNIAKINYFPTSTQRLYKIGDGSWKIYTNQDIRLDEGQVIYAKGIDKNGKETHVVSSYTSVLPSDAIGKAAYDEDSSTYFEVYGYCYNPSKKYVMNISDEMQGKNIVINLQNTGGEYIAYTQSRIGFIDGNGTKLSEQVYSQNVSKRDIVLTIPNGAKKLEMQITASNVGSQWQTFARLHIYEIDVSN